MEQDATNRKPVGTREWYDFVGRIDDEITKRGKGYMGYTLIVGQKAG
jgi:hypothetical protein